MDLKLLKREIPFKWRVQSANQWGAQCVAYIDARDAQDLLDDVCGPEKWQVTYEEHKGNLFASIGIFAGDQWVWKTDCGTESNVEKEKGEASDAFKRAGVMWGIGRFLYAKKIIKLPVKANDKGKFLPFSEKTSKFVYGSDAITAWCNDLYAKKPTKTTKPEPKQEILSDENMIWFRSGEGVTIEKLKAGLKMRNITPEQKIELQNLLTVAENEYKNLE
jgi:hypothetical protein